MVAKIGENKEVESPEDDRGEEIGDDPLTIRVQKEGVNLTTNEDDSGMIQLEYHVNQEFAEGWYT